ncbi:Uncharacterised protein [Mycobacteroides abscessus subsp. abscessus]|nr:Uncharacterised protein [Mycobacteroides abscessus subsp. abscessus]
MRARFWSSAAAITCRLCQRTVLKKSVHRPCLSSLVLNVAYGPNITYGRPSTMRLSRCGTDIGGAPTGACPYTLVVCASATAALAERRNAAPTGRTAYPRTSARCARCRSRSACPPAPTNTL